VADSENKCPACKAEINKISYITVTGELKEVEIEEKQQDENYDDTPYQCHTCQAVLEDADFEENRNNRNIAVVCENCLEHAIHQRCMNMQAATVFANCGEWLCPGCVDYL
jgi:hypothetical protein